MLRLIFSIPFLLMGTFALAAVFVPRWRTGWRGTSVIGGATTHLGFGLAFTAAGAILALAKDNQDPIILAIFGPPLFVALPLVLIGNWLDMQQPRIDRQR